MIELLILGLLVNHSPLHGYEIKRQLDEMLIGGFSKISYGSLYPILNKLQKSDFVKKHEDPKGDMKRFPFSITGDGKERFLELMNSDEVSLSYKLLFFNQIDSSRRKEILQHHKEHLQLKLTSRLEQKNKLEMVLDKYKSALLERSIEKIQSEINWIGKLEKGKKTIE